MNPVASAEIDSYLDAVRTAFADLPAAELDELLEDIAEHLAEVAAESAEPLTDRLGPPAAYAEELRAAAGFPTTVTGAGRGWRGAGRWRRPWDALGLAGLMFAADHRLGPIFGYERLTDFLRQLAPAWWVIRGYAAAMLVLWLVDFPTGPLPRAAGSVFIGLFLTLPMIAVSVSLGRRGSARNPRGRRLAWLANAALALVIVSALNHTGLRVGPRYDEAGHPSPPAAMATVAEVNALQGLCVIDGDADAVLVGRWTDLAGSQRCTVVSKLTPKTWVVVPRPALGPDGGSGPEVWRWNYWRPPYLVDPRDGSPAPRPSPSS